jgi:hypothetical protein
MRRPEALFGTLPYAVVRGRWRLSAGGRGEYVAKSRGLLGVVSKADRGCHAATAWPVSPRRARFCGHLRTGPGPPGGSGPTSLLQCKALLQPVVTGYLERMPEGTSQLPARPEHPATPRQLGPWSRIGATTIGLAGLGSGAVADFVTHLEAGPVGLLAVGFLLLVIGMSGRLPTRLKLGDNEAEWQEERGAFAEFVEQVTVSSPNINNADLIDALDKLAQAAPEVANPALTAMAYEALVMETISGLARGPLGGGQPAGFSLVGPAGRRTPVDAILEAADGTRIAVEINAGPRATGAAKQSARPLVCDPRATL